MEPNEDTQLDRDESLLPDTMQNRKMRLTLWALVRIWVVSFVLYLFADYLLHGLILVGLDHSQLSGVVLTKPNLAPLFLYYAVVTLTFVVVLFYSGCSLARRLRTIAIAAELAIALNISVHLINLAVLPKWSVLFAVVDTVAVVIEDLLLALLVVWLIRVLRLETSPTRDYSAR